jgi:predicted nucleic acid-binding protein
MAWLLDTNVVSELYKGTRGASTVRTWLQDAIPEELFLSVLVLGEIRHGIELLRRKDPSSARSLENWFLGLENVYQDRILPVTREICDLWGRLSIVQKLPAVDGLLAATALHHGLTLVTRNTRDIARSGVDYFNPFTGARR